jgi:ATP:ADP antiporter, AAA family
MTGTASEATATSQGHLQRFVSVKQDEVAALLASFTMFFTLLCAYYIIRPVRDEMGARIAHDGMQNLFSVVFVVMLAAVPMFGWIASRFPRRQVLPGLYLFFAMNLVVFWSLTQRRRRQQVDHRQFLRLGQRL